MMDERTRQKYLARHQVFTHLTAGHLSRKPNGQTYEEAATAGLQASLALWQEFVTREYRARIAQHEARNTRLTEELENLHAEMSHMQLALVEAQSTHAVPVGAGVDALYSGPQERWGIGRGLPAGDA